jgi:YesN/AraC family two-component response regulator
MPEMDGIELMQAATKMDPHLVCIIITGKGTIQTAVEAMKTGAFDYLLKPIEWKMLRPILSRAIEVRRLRKAEERYRSVVEDQTELVCRFLPTDWNSTRQPLSSNIVRFVHCCQHISPLAFITRFSCISTGLYMPH